ncbi:MULTISPECIES: thiosulfate sulfurtransferase GlpE [unclassified Mannheimia]|uniref:thiosulfate sulfurtransferase GlpE n=1 Tax=unclassified Mannheimia TaxID=2645054 RepID=UPI00359D2B8B
MSEITFKEITPQQAWELMENEGAVLADIRDTRRYVYSHPQDAFHLTNQSYGKFLDEVDYDESVLVICYHGVSSQSTAQFLIEQGFENVYSVKGGFEAWERNGLPIETSY